MLGRSGGQYRLNITITDPVEHKESIHAYVTYKVKTSTDRPEFQYTQFNVIRRFKDFEWLYTRLSDEFPGVIMPPLPEKKPKIAGGMDKNFINRRILELERFMNRIGAHQELSGSESFRTFLCADDASLAETKEAEKAQRRQATGPNIQKWFTESITIVSKQVKDLSQDVSGAPTTNNEVPKTEADVKFEEINTYVNDLSAQLKNVAEHSSSLVKGKEKLGNTLYEFGFAFTQLAKAEEEKAPLGQALLLVGHTADDVSAHVKKQAMQEAKHFESPMHDYVRIVDSLKTALRKRQEKKITYLTAANNLEARTQAHAKIKGVGKEDKIAQAAEAIEIARVAQETAEQEYIDVGERVVREFTRFQQEKEVDIKKMLLDFVNVQVEYSKLQEERWQKLIPQIEAMELEGGGVVGALTGYPFGGPNSKEDLVGV